MTEEEKTQYFIDLYMAALRGFYHNDFLKDPNPISDRYKQLEQARRIVDDLGGEYAEYINVQFAAFRRFRTAPKPPHLILEGAIKRYKAYQRKNNIFYTKEYRTYGDYLEVSKTRKVYPLSQVLLPVSQDTTALMAYSLVKDKIKEGVRITEGNGESIYYLEAKLKYKGVEVPDAIKEILSLLKE